MNNTRNTRNTRTGTDQLLQGRYLDASQLLHGRRQCSICARRLHWRALLVDALDIPSEHAQSGQTWLLCVPCFTAVRNHVQQSASQHPARVLVALGIVASQRSPKFRAPWMDRIGEPLLDNFFPVILGGAMLLHVVLALFIGLVR